ncbi:type VI secretion system-associated FHA domain protein TagH [Methyloglobulus sp.]|uniref:type VI secretion system-associated FHA domain protein TagH n=1 Tax=Methyloglobulus sp. TaxID=2518622 RepID=UPI0039895826
MKLLLSVISSKANLDRASRITLNQESASIGRHEDNTLVLFDPKRYISSHHALIEYKAPDYFVTDISANGVLVNQSLKPLGKGNKTKLKDGDQLNIGDYTIYVKLLEDSIYPVAVPSEPIIAHDIEIFDDPFADFDSDPIQKMIDSNELIPSTWKGQELPEDLFGIPGLDNKASNLSDNNKHDNTAFDHIPAYKEAFQPPPKKLVDQPVTTTDPPDFFSEAWFLDKGDTTEEIIAVKAFPPLIIEPNQPPPVTIPEPVTTSSATDFQNELIQNFLKGAKLENGKFAETINPQTFYIIGTILRASIQGTRDVLEGRAQIKNEMHLDVTLIRPKENNPIKFSVNTDEALTKLLTPADKAYLSPEKAINEAFDDIRTHQYSVIAGMKSALFAILKRFDPKILEERLQKQSPIAANIPIHKQAKLWGLFEDLYETLEQETKDNFYHLFGRAFADTYSQLINKIKKDNPI